MDSAGQAVHQGGAKAKDLKSVVLLATTKAVGMIIPSRVFLTIALFILPSVAEAQSKRNFLLSLK
jgi:hypothetical protein